MNAVSLSEAQENLVKIVHDLARQGELLITDNNRPIARLSPISADVQTSLRDLKPASVGKLLRPFPSPEDDTFGEMLESFR
jgi:antitoxin (DNA-binding transcriptional repressor) of toxin-antitoxin stability system